MEFFLIITLYWKRFLLDFHKRKSVTILSSLSYLYLIFILLFASISFATILSAKAIGYFLFSYFIVDFALRLLFQKIDGSALEFAVLPIRRTALINFILLKNSINIFNAIPLLLFAPLFLTHEDSAPYLFSLISSILTINCTVIQFRMIDNVMAKAAFRH